MPQEPSNPPTQSSSTRYSAEPGRGAQGGSPSKAVIIGVLVAVIAVVVFLLARR